jgi:hypothetical protein
MHGIRTENLNLKIALVAEEWTSSSYIKGLIFDVNCKCCLLLLSVAFVLWKATYEPIESLNPELTQLLSFSVTRVQNVLSFKVQLQCYFSLRQGSVARSDFSPDWRIENFFVFCSSIIQFFGLQISVFVLHRLTFQSENSIKISLLPSQTPR